jgi:hypothetical protein
MAHHWQELSIWYFRFHQFGRIMSEIAGRHGNLLWRPAERSV